jgi:hypothetical protein
MPEIRRVGPARHAALSRPRRRAARAVSALPCMQCRVSCRCMPPRRPFAPLRIRARAGGGEEGNVAPVPPRIAGGNAAAVGR